MVLVNKFKTNTTVSYVLAICVHKKHGFEDLYEPLLYMVTS